MRTALRAGANRRVGRARSTSLSTVPPAKNDEEYLPELAAAAASILYRSPLPSLEGRPIYILNAAAFPDAYEVDYDSLLAYVLARLPGEDELISGAEYEVVFFAGGTPDNATAEKKQGPSNGWYLQAYHVLSRALRKKLQRLYIVHPRTWVRVLISVFGTIVSPKFRRKIVHVNSMSQLALHVPIEKMLIPPAAYLQDRKVSPDIYAPFVTGKRAFGVRHPLPKDISTGATRLPRLLRETTSFLLMPTNVTTEGLFRIPPHSTLAGVLKEAYDRGQHFIIWKEKGASFAPPGIDQALVDEVRLEDAYGVHLAAALIKTWYRELREPIFPESTYAEFKERYSDPNVQVSPEDLVDLILPASRASPLPETSREIMTRHLLPLLSTVASHESDNKMNSENLAILFSMCLVCGSNQMEDGKMSTIVKRILKSAIELWPELRTGMGIDDESFQADLQPPADPNQYEDPLEDLKPKGSSEGDEQQEVGHRIIMDEDESPPRPAPISPEGPAPALPPRRSRKASLKNALQPLIPDIDIASMPRPKMQLPTLPKRKPAPQHPDPPSTLAHDAPMVDQPALPEPPRYSTLYDSDGRSVQVADSPSSYVPPDGFGPPRRADFSFEGDEKLQQKAASYPEPGDPSLLITVPKRKAVSSSQKTSPEGTIDGTSDVPSAAAGTNAMLARMAAQQAASNLAQRITIDSSNASLASKAGVINSAPAGSVQSPDQDDVFRKPSWPASSNRQQPNIQSLAKPVIPHQTVPIITGASTAHEDNSLQPGTTYPKPRTPSPGLLKRMTSMESGLNATHSAATAAATKAASSLGPRPLNLRKTSVDDLRRLYEDRVNMAHSLAAGVERKRSTSSQV